MRRRTLVGGLALSALSSRAIVHAQEIKEVDVALALAVDLSSSMDQPQYEMQINGYSDAFDDATIIRRISQGRCGKIAVCVIFWSGHSSQVIAIDWTLVEDAASAQALAERIRSARRTIYGYTSIGGALRFTATRFTEAAMRLTSGPAFWTKRKIIDISGDGHDNFYKYGPSLLKDVYSLKRNRQMVLESGVVINGLPIIHKEPNIPEYYEDNVIGGGGSFSLVAKDFTSFPKAIKLKLWREISA